MTDETRRYLECELATCEALARDSDSEAHRRDYAAIVSHYREVIADVDRLASVLCLCVRRRPCSEVPDAIRWAINLPGSWGEGYPTREAAEAAVLARAKEGDHETR